MNIQEGWENVREAAGWDRDVMVHCSWNYDLRTSIQIAEAVASARPVWLEDPMAVPYTESWKRLTEVSKTPICMGENLVFREQFMDFIINVGADIIHPDLRNTGGFLATSRIAQIASIYGLPMATHNTGSQINTYAAAQWAGSIKDYIALKTHHRAGRLDGQGAVASRPVYQGRVHRGPRSGQVSASSSIQTSFAPTWRPVKRGGGSRRKR